MNGSEVIGAENLKRLDELSAEIMEAINKPHPHEAEIKKDIELLEKRQQEERLQEAKIQLENNLQWYKAAVNKFLEGKDIKEQLDFYRQERKRCSTELELDEHSFFYYDRPEIIKIYNTFTYDTPVNQLQLPAISFIKYLDKSIELMVEEESDNQKIYGSIRQQAPPPPAKQGYREPFLIRDEKGNYRFADGNHGNTRKTMTQFYFYYETEITDSESNWESVVRTWINNLVGTDKFDFDSTRNLQTMITYLTRTAKADKDKNNAAIAKTPRNAQAIEEIAALFDELGINQKYDCDYQ